MAGTTFSNFTDGGLPLSTDQVVGLRDGVNTIFDYSPTQMVVSISQAAHGLVVGNVLKFDGTLYALAQADSVTNAEVIGIVSTVIDANTFSLQFGGLVSGLTGLVAGTLYFLSEAVAGALTATEPSVVGEVSKPLLVAVSTTSGFLFNYRGQVL